MDCEKGFGEHTFCQWSLVNSLIVCGSWEYWCVMGSSITLSLADWPGYRDFNVLDMWVLLFVLGGLVG